MRGLALPVWLAAATSSAACAGPALERRSETVTAAQSSGGDPAEDARPAPGAAALHGPPVVDAGVAPLDGGVPTLDAGAPLLDAQVPARDGGGAAPADAGLWPSLPDAGIAPPPPLPPEPSRPDAGIDPPIRLPDAGGPIPLRAR